MQPIVRHSLRAYIYPRPHSCASLIFYRHSFAAWSFTVPRKEVVFELDMRPRKAPKLDAFPR